MRKTKAIRLAVSVLLCAVISFLSGCSFNFPNNDSRTDTATLPSPSSDRVQVPDFNMTLLDGSVVSFSEFRGKKVLLNFWATWCAPCVGELPAFERLSTEYPNELVVLAVNCGEDRRTVQRFNDVNGYTFRMVLDTNGLIQAMFGGIESIPVTVIIDENGCIITSITGASDADTMYREYKSKLGL